MGNNFCRCIGCTNNVNVSTITGQANFSIRPSKPSKSRAHDCFNAQRLFETSQVVIGPNIKDDLKSFESIFFFQMI